MAKDDEREILTSLPGTRPQRPNARRDAARARAAGPQRGGAAEKAEAEGRPAAKRPRPVAKAKAGTTSAAKPRAKAKAATTSATKPRAKARAAATAAAKRPRPVATDAPASPKPRRAVRAVTDQGTPAAGYAPRPETEPSSLPAGVELVGTAVQATGELARIGLAVGGQALRSALGRLARRP